MCELVETPREFGETSELIGIFPFHRSISLRSLRVLAANSPPNKKSDLLILMLPKRFLCIQLRESNRSLFLFRMCECDHFRLHLNRRKSNFVSVLFYWIIDHKNGIHSTAKTTAPAFNILSLPFTNIVDTNGLIEKHNYVFTEGETVVHILVR